MLLELELKKCGQENHWFVKRCIEDMFCVFLTLVGGVWYTYPSEKYKFVSWDDYSQDMEKFKNVPNHQPDWLGLE